MAVVHNGIIENHEHLREQQTKAGYEFTSQTDTEVIVHQVYHHHIEGKKDLLVAVQDALRDLEGAYALGVISNAEPGRMITARRGSPLVIGVGIGEYFIASDVAALLPVTQRFIFLQEGDVADLRRDSLTIYDERGKQVERPIKESELTADAVERGTYRHYMEKEIHVPWPMPWKGVSVVTSYSNRPLVLMPARSSIRSRVCISLPVVPVITRV